MKVEGATPYTCPNCNTPYVFRHTCENLVRNITTLPTDSKARKDYPLYSGCLAYFPAALAGVAKLSKQGNDKHNSGESLHHARAKSGDHADCVLRHLLDLQDLLATAERGIEVPSEIILGEASAMAWRCLAYAQELHERFGAPLAPGAKQASPSSEYIRQVMVEREAE